MKPHGNKGKKKSPEHRAKLLKSLVPFKKGEDSRRFDGNHTEESRRLMSSKGLGKKKRGQGEDGEYLTPIHSRIRESREYKVWRTSVFRRDNFTCLLCGTKKRPFHADHIKPFAYFPELRFVLENGRTLCVPCHKQTETWGRRKPFVVFRPDDVK